MVESDTMDVISVDIPTATKYKQKQELDIRKDNWMHFPIYSGIAVYAYDYIEKNKKKGRD